jgi:hypothetical protein
MNPTLDEIYSIINGFQFADDKDRVFTYIEFIKMFGYDNDTNIFITYYKEYDSEEKWVSIVNADQRLSNKITLKMQSGKEHVFWLAPGEMRLEKLADLI